MHRLRQVRKEGTANVKSHSALRGDCSEPTPGGRVGQLNSKLTKMPNLKANMVTEIFVQQHLAYKTLSFIKLPS